MSYRNVIAGSAVSLVAAVATFAPHLAAAESKKSGTEVVQTAVSVKNEQGAVTTVAQGKGDAKSVASTCGENAVSVATADGYVTCQSVTPGEDVPPFPPPERLGISSLVATHYLNIPATSCATFGAVPTENCSGGGTLRTDGDGNFPCTLPSRPVRDTYICALELPSGAAIEEIIAYGMDFDPTGYFEAAVWNTDNGTFGPSYFSSFGGTWQSSGVAFNGGPTSFPIFSASQAPHTVLPNARYTIGFATKAPSSNSIIMHGFRVRYSL